MASKTNQCLSIFWKFLSAFDFFTLTPASRVTFKGGLVYSTLLGKIMTLAIIICSVGAFVYFGVNMMQRFSPQTILAQKYSNDPAYSNLTKETFFLSFGMRNFDSGIISSDETFFTPTLKVMLRSKIDNTSSSINVTLGHCNNSDIPDSDDLKDYFSTNPISNMWCVKDYFPLEMQGSLDSDYYKYISLSIHKCNASKTPNCKSDLEIDDFFNNNEFFMHYTTYAVDPLNYRHPMNLHGNFYAIPTNNITKSLVFIMFSHLQIKTDDGVVIKDSHFDFGIAKVHDRAYFTPRTSQQVYVEVRLNLDKVSTIYERTYDKLQQVLANTGGSIKILMILALFLTKPFVTFYFYRDLSNEYFDYELPNQNNELVKSKMDLNVFEYYLSFIRKKDQKLQLKKRIWDKARHVLDANVSLSQLLMKIAELEKLKFLLLEKQQLVLFEYIPKPTITEKSEVTRELFKRSTYHTLATGVWKFNDTFFKKYMQEDLQTAYQEIMGKRKKNKKDIMLLKLIGEEIKDEKLKKYDEFLNEKNKKEDFMKILSHSDEGYNDISSPPPLNVLYIDGKAIVRDLESLK